MSRYWDEDQVAIASNRAADDIRIAEEHADEAYERDRED